MNAPARRDRPESGATYGDNHAYLADELGKLDLLLRLRVTAFRRSWQSRPEAAGQSLYISDAEVDWLLDGEPASPFDVSAEARLREALHARQEEIDARGGESLRRGVPLALPQLARLFGLSAFEVQAVLICLAPELRCRYDRLYAYLQDDIARKRPSVDLVLELLCEGEAEKWSARALLAPQAPLLHTGILQTVDDPQSPSGSSGLAQFLRLDPRILHFLLGHGTLDARLTNLVELHHAPRAPSSGELTTEPEVGAALLSFAERWSSDLAAVRHRTVLHLQGPRGVGKQELVLAVCGVLERPLLCLDAQRLPGNLEEAETLLRLAFRESLLLQAPLYVAPASVFLGEGEQAVALRKALAQAVEFYGWLVFLAGEEPWPHRDRFEQAVFYSTALPMPGVPVRENAWKQALRDTLPEAPGDELAARLAERFRLTPGQIREAATALAHRRLVCGAGQPVTFELLGAACRAQAQHDLAALASKVEPCHTWEDLILPADKLVQLREMCSQVRHEHLVHDGWGFGRRLSRGRGISALFSGPPGTGKTIAAEVIAAELQLDLYKIDLARVVSKYIGETEKNLSRVFAEAEDSNAILFFDEADALFGKRTEISDAHDRYANLETSYLLQRMEEYAGVVILASNLRENMDDAFLRRIRFLVDFPFPDTASRLRIWQTHFPPEAPVAEEVNYALLAERIQVAGGNIKNIVLSAAFFAAADGGVIRMEHLLQGTRREYDKIGKLWDGQAFTRPLPSRHAT
ncbi:MAG: ATP-binding protein [Gemmatimonadales bacterium]|nr:ATP-binding protein [Gemmatimonadales bacterium]